MMLASQVNLLEDQLVWAPMGPPSEAAAIVSSATLAAMSSLHCPQSHEPASNSES